MAAPSQSLPRTVGVVHLPPLPGSPRHAGADFVAHALRDARVLFEAGFDALIVENFGDAPFFKEEVPPETIASIALSVRAVCEAVPIPVGVNVLRNAARAALGIAAATGAAFIRVNVHTGAAVTDQGVIEGRAAETLRARAALGAAVWIFADVHVKHAAPLAVAPLDLAVEEAAGRGLADAVIVTGASTGRPPDQEHLRRARSGLAGSSAALYAGSGVSAESAALYAPLVDGVIVGTALKEGGRTANPVDPARARAFIEAWARAAPS